MAARKQQSDDAEQQDEQDEGQEMEDESTTSIDIAESSITVTVPRDGNEGETLSRLSKLVDGLGQ